MECETGLRAGARIGVAVQDERPEILTALLDVLVGYVQKLLAIVSASGVTLTLPQGVVLRWVGG